LVGVIPIDTSVAAVTVSVVDPETPPAVAETVVEPTRAADAKPDEPEALLIDATVVFAEDQATELVRSCVEPSVYTPVAANCCAVPAAIDGFPGVTPIDTSVATVTVSVVDPETPPAVAEMVVVPTPAEVAKPAEPEALLIDATVGFDEAQVTEAVRFCVELSV